MSLKLATGPAAEPVTRTEAKLHLRVDHTDEDTMIDSLITLARSDVERISNCALISQTWDLVLDSWPQRIFNIPLFPLASITSIKWKSKAGVETTITSTNYVLDTASRPGRVALIDGYSWPSDTLYPISGITIKFVAGFGLSGTNVPARFKQAMLLLIGHYYENREAVFSGTGANLQRLPMGVSALLADDIRRAF